MDRNHFRNLRKNAKLSYGFFDQRFWTYSEEWHADDRTHRRGLYLAADRVLQESYLVP